MVLSQGNSHKAEAFGPLGGEHLCAVHVFADFTGGHIVDILLFGDLDKVGIAGECDAGQVEDDSQKFSECRAATHFECRQSNCPILEKEKYFLFCAKCKIFQMRNMTALF